MIAIVAEKRQNHPNENLLIDTFVDETNSLYQEFGPA